MARAASKRFKTPPNRRSLELQRGRTLGATGWADRTRYVFTFQTTPDRVQVRVNGVLELDVRGDFSFGSGRFGFYNFSQEFVRYSAFSSQGLTFFEGEPATISLPFSDVGVLDTHTATIDWRDGTVEPGTVVSADGSGLVSDAHAYSDDGTPQIEICVTDDDGGEDCGAFPATVINVEPSFSVGPDRLAYVGEGLVVEVPFTDPGTADTHTATIDWGDGIAEAATVAGGAGSGTVTGSHDYAAEGTYTVEVCVTDDDGGSRCDTFEVTWLEPRLDFSITKTASLGAVRPGETLVYGLTVDNLGTREPQNLIVRDALPSGLDFIAASAGGVFDAATRTVTWTLPRLDFESSVELQLITSAPADSAAFGTPLVNTASVEDDGRFGPDLDPSNNLSTAESVAWDGMTPRVGAVTQALRLEENEDLSILARFDDPYLATAPPSIPVTGLIAEWSFDQASDPFLGTGPSRYPARLGSVPGADPNDPAYACAVGIAPVAGNLCALELTGRSTDATDDFVSVANEPALDFTAAYTLSGWVRWDSAVNDHRPIFIRGAADGTTNANDLEVYIQRNSRDLVVYHNRGNGGSARFVTFGDPPRDRLFHLAVTYDGARVRVYYDGVEQGSGSLVPALATGRDWMFGKVDHSAFGGGRTRYFDGLIDEVRFYDRALGVPEVEALAARSGVGEAHTATIDWGDGTVEAGVLNDPLGGLISGTHRYLDDYAGDIEICVTDDAANVGCGRIPVEVENVAPGVNDDSDIDLRLWQAEGLDDEFDWDVAADGSSVLQRLNGPPTFFYGDFSAFSTRIEGTIEVRTRDDDDFIGFALGYLPGDLTNPDAEYLLVNWKRLEQSISESASSFVGCERSASDVRGLRVARVLGTPLEAEFWSHNDAPCNGPENGLEVLARGATLGDVGWEPFTPYTFTFEYLPNRLRVFVNGQLEIDVEGDFPNGRLTFYNHSHAQVRYSAFRFLPREFDEGQAVDLEAFFTDQGPLDTHVAEFDWQDGTVTPGVIDTVFSAARGNHVFLDNALYPVEACVTD
ncbi:MAG: LamG-like jellyroll fold domain-containing protein, partial [Acidobacteriota bacterium]